VLERFCLIISVSLGQRIGLKTNWAFAKWDLFGLMPKGEMCRLDRWLKPTAIKRISRHRLGEFKI
jgi:hypothetical protein